MRLYDFGRTVYAWTRDKSTLPLSAETAPKAFGAPTQAMTSIALQDLADSRPERNRAGWFSPSRREPIVATALLLGAWRMR